jgi:hypothetical protein
MINFVRASAQYLTSVSNYTPTTVGSISFWLTPTTLINNNYVFYCTSANFSFYLRTTAGGHFTYRLNVGSNGDSVLAPVAGTLYHIIATWTTTTNSLYINGALDSTRTITQALVAAGSFRIARDAGTNYLNGSLRDFRIYNRALDLSEVQTIYGCNGSDSIYYGLSNRYMMNELGSGVAATGAGSVVDSSNTPINMTPTGSPLYGDELLNFKRRYLKR